MKKGFTLIEILLVIGTMIILVVLGVLSLRFIQKESDLSNAARVIISTLRLAQNKTLASEKASQYGVYFDNTITPHQYTLFEGSDYANREVIFDEIHKLPKSIEIYDINLAEGKEVVFNRLDGKALPDGNLSIRLINATSTTKTIYIESSGLIALTNISAPMGDRITDSRHVHFELGWSIQNAAFLKFYFPNIPQTETVDMANYFNFDKTEFDWSGTFLVNEKEQVFQIHTHFLDAVNTSFCIHRDRNNGKNDQEVIIYIVDGEMDKEIAHYLADVEDTVAEGVFGGIMEIQ